MKTKAILISITGAIPLPKGRMYSASAHRENHPENHRFFIGMPRLPHLLIVVRARRARSSHREKIREHEHLPHSSPENQLFKPQKAFNFKMNKMNKMNKVSFPEKS